MLSTPLTGTGDSFSGGERRARTGWDAGGKGAEGGAGEYASGTEVDDTSTTSPPAIRRTVNVIYHYSFSYPHPCHRLCCYVGNAVGPPGSDHWRLEPERWAPRPSTGKLTHHDRVTSQ